jgi:hypothetical protein
LDALDAMDATDAMDGLDTLEANGCRGFYGSMDVMNLIDAMDGMNVLNAMDILVDAWMSRMSWMPAFRKIYRLKNTKVLNKLRKNISRCAKKGKNKTAGFLE